MKDLTACYNLLTTLYSYAFQLREEIVEIENTIFDTRTMMLDFYDKIPEDEHFSMLVRNMKENLEKINQIFISNEQKFKNWITQDKINLFECDFLLKQQKDVLEKEYQKHEYLLSCFDEEHHEAMEFWDRWFSESRFVDKIRFFEVYQREYGKINPKTVDVMSYYIDFNRDGLVSVYKFYKFLNYFGSFKMFVQNIESLIQKNIYIFSISSIKANPKLRNFKCGTYLLRFSKSHSNSFAISFKNERNQIKQFLVSCSKKGLRLKNSEKIYPNLTEFISSNSSVLRYNLDKERLGVDMYNYQIEMSQEMIGVKSFMRVRGENRSFCNNCKRSLTDSV